MNFDENGGWRYNPGYCRYSIYNGKLSNTVHISPDVATGGDIYFAAIAGHELIHAHHLNLFGSSFDKYFSERVAYFYTFTVADKYPSSMNKWEFMKTSIYEYGGFGHFPSNYGDVLKTINFDFLNIYLDADIMNSFYLH